MPNTLRRRRNTTGPFSPRQLPGLVLWLKADAIPVVADGTALATWPDSSSFGNNATQATGSFQPLYKTAIVNGLPVVRFDGSNDVMMTGTSVCGSQPFSWFVVAKAAASGVTISLLASDSSDNCVIYLLDSGPWSLYGGAGMQAGSAGQTSWHVHEAVFASKASRRGVDGVLTVGDGGTNGAPGITVGASAAGNTEFWNGDIAEIICCRGSLAWPYCLQTRRYLATKYLLTVI